MKGVQCYELFGGIALKNYAFLYSVSFYIAVLILRPEYITYLNSITRNFRYIAIFYSKNYLINPMFLLLRITVNF